jgi:hypothetical protein
VNRWSRKIAAVSRVSTLWNAEKGALVATLRTASRMYVFTD